MTRVYVEGGSMVEVREAEMTSRDIWGVKRVIGEGVEAGQLLARTEDELRALIEEGCLWLGQGIGFGSVVACCALDVYTPRLAEVRSLRYINDIHEGDQNIGSSLVKQAIAEAERRKITRLLTVTHQPALFASLGFREELSGQRAMVMNLKDAVREEPASLSNHTLIRPAVTIDIPDIQRLIKDGERGGQLLPRGDDEIEEQVENGLIFVADYDKSVVGCASLERYTRIQGEVRSLYVDESQRHQDIGSNLIETAVLKAQELNLGRLLVITGEPALFAARGFADKLKDQKVMFMSLAA